MPRSPHPADAAQLEVLRAALVDALGLPELRAEVEDLRREVEAIKSRSLVCPSCGSTNFRTTNTSRTERGVRRLKRCRGCGERVTTHEVIG